jgi:integrase
MSDSMTSIEPAASAVARAMRVHKPRDMSDSDAKALTVRSTSRKKAPAGRRWRPHSGLMPEDVQAVIAAASCERDRLLLRVLWATGCRITEALELRPRDVGRDSLLLPNRKNPARPLKRVILPAGLADLPGDLLVWANEQHLAGHEPLFFSQKRAADGQLRAINRGQAWHIVKHASERADVRVLALRDSKDGLRGHPAPIHPHILRHSRVRQNLRSGTSLPVVQSQAGWTYLQPTYLTPDEDEVRRAMANVLE